MPDSDPNELLARLLNIITADDLERLVHHLEDVQTYGFGYVQVEIRKNSPVLITHQASDQLSGARRAAQMG